jgi:hypothetical protein
MIPRMIAANDRLGGKLPWYTNKSLFSFMHVFHFGWIFKIALFNNTPETSFTHKKLFAE